MSRIFKVSRSIAVGSAAVIALAACSGDGGESESGAEAAADAEPANIRVWINGEDTPQEARDYLTTTFAEQNEGSEVTIEEQSWTGIVDKLTTSLSGSDTPDVVEVGNTQAAAFTSAGAFADLSDSFDALGGDDLLPGFVEAGTYDDTVYAVPYYAGARVIFYNKELYEKAGLEEPTTLEEYVENGKTLAAENDGVSGVYFPGQDWYNALPYIWSEGGEIATQDGEEWAAGLSSPESQAGLEMVQDVMENASVAPKDGDETSAEVPYCAGKIAQISAPSWFQGSILAAEDAETPGCPDQEENLGVFALPGPDGDAAPVFAGGSNLAVSAGSENPELAKAALEIMLSDEYQTILGEAGLVPAKTSLADTIGDDPAAQAINKAISNAKLTPASPEWATVEAEGVLQDFFSKIALGGDIAELAPAVDEKINGILNG